MQTCFHALVLSAAVASAQVLDEDAKLLAGDGAAGDAFGFAIAVDAGVVAVGAPGDGEHGEGSGSVYLFDALTGQQIDKIVPGDGAAGDGFGVAVAMRGGLLVVGASGDSDNGAASGSAYVFDVSTGQQIAKLLADDGAAGDGFGGAVAVDVGAAAVGAAGDDDNGAGSGSAYLFDTASGQQIAKLLPGVGAVNNQFGCSVAIDGGVVAVGELFGDGDNGDNSGVVHVYDAATGALQGGLIPQDGGIDQYFGHAVALRGDVLAVGAPRDGENGSLTGAVYLFDLSAWTQTAKLFPVERGTQDAFGSSVAIDVGLVAAGAIGDDDHGESSGSVFVFDAETGQEITGLVPSDGASGDLFGWGVAVDDGLVAASAILDDDGGQDSGSAYLFGVSRVITAHPASRQIVSVGDVARFEIEVYGDNLSFQWRQDGVPLASNGDSVRGARSRRLLITASIERVGLYDCVISDGIGETTSENSMLAVRAPCPADNTEPWGLLDLADVLGFVSSFNEGCE